MLMTPETNQCAGFCNSCNTEHSLPLGNALSRGEELCSLMEQQRSIALDGEDSGDLRLSTAPLFGDSRGKMFGVLECLDAGGAVTWLYAFSGQYNGCWLVDGWAPPLFDVGAFHALNDPVETRIKRLGQEIEGTPPGSKERAELIAQRKQMARELMRDIHKLYRLKNFREVTGNLDDAFNYGGGKPTGTGDCCAPKLLNQAALAGHVPLSLAEFYFGRENRSGTRQHGVFYRPCRDKCGPILGFMLCGLQESGATHGG